MSEVDILIRVVRECEAAGGDVKQLLQLLTSKLTLAEQMKIYEALIKEIQARVAQWQEAERATLLGRDDALHALKNAKTQLDAILAQIAALLETKADAEEIKKKIEELTNHISQLKEEIGKLEEEKTGLKCYNAPALWLLGVLTNNPDLLRKHIREILKLLEQPPTDQAFTEEICRTLIELVIDELKKRNELVPKYKLMEATLAADNLKFRTEMVMKPFIRDPNSLTLEQRLVLLGIIHDLGITKDNFEEFTSKVAVSWRKCPTHKNNLRVSLFTLKYQCTVPGCTHTE